MEKEAEKPNRDSIFGIEITRNQLFTTVPWNFLATYVLVTRVAKKLSIAR